MMGYRKLPFGYQIELGEIALNPDEAKVVDDIFRWYISGDSYSVLVKKLQEQPVRYSEGKSWNKNMVARILEDKRYTGTEDFPMIILPEVLTNTQKKRSAKQVPVQKSPAQKLLRQLSGCTATEQMERQVLDLLNGLAGHPEQITASPSGKKISSTVQLQRELKTILEKQPINEEAAKRLIFAAAAEKYRDIGSEEYETVRLKRIMAGIAPSRELDPELLRNTVSKIHISAMGNIRIKLKNNQIIERGKANA